MQWPLVKFRKFVSLALLAGVYSGEVGSVEEDRLWLPVKYQRLFLELKRAAEEAEKLDRCVKVLKGTISIDKSQDDHPIYRVLCRQENGRTYNEMVDGVTFETLTTQITIPPTPSPEEIAARIQHLWGLCDARLKEKTRLMNSVSRLGDEGRTPTHFDDESAQYTIDFDTQDTYGKTLKFRAVCNVSSDEQAKVEVSARKDE